MTWRDGRGRVIRSWIAIFLSGGALLGTGMWYGIETYFQARQNARDIERLQSQMQLNRDLIWERTGYSQGGE